MLLKTRGFFALSGIAASAWTASAAGYAIDDGLAETSVGLVNQSQGYDSIWLNTFSLSAGDSVIDQISIVFGISGGTGLSLEGRAVTVLLYTDPTGGTPWDASLVWSLNTTIANSNSTTFNNYAVPSVAVGINFVVGFRYNESRALIGATVGSFPAALDQTDPDLSNRSYAGFTFPASSPPLDINDLAGSIPGGNRAAIESFGQPGNFLIRARGTVPAPVTASVLGLAGLGGLRRRR